MNTTLLAAAIIIATTTNVNAGIVVDGDLKDWINQPSSMAGLNNVLSNTTRYNVDYLDGAIGGQVYNAEAMYTRIEDNNLKVAILTGLPDHYTQYPAGDIALSFDCFGKYYLLFQSFYHNTGIERDVFCLARESNRGLHLPDTNNFCALRVGASLALHIEAKCPRNRNPYKSNLSL